MQDAEDSVQKRLEAYTPRDIHEPQDMFGGLDKNSKKEKLSPGGNTSVPMYIEDIIFMFFTKSQPHPRTARYVRWARSRIRKKEKLGHGGNTSVPMFIVYTLPNANHIPLRREQKRISTR